MTTEGKLHKIVVGHCSKCRPDEWRAENGWAPRLTLRITTEEAEIVDRIASPGDSRG